MELTKRRKEAIQSLILALLHALAPRFAALVNDISVAHAASQKKDLINQILKSPNTIVRCCQLIFLALSSPSASLQLCMRAAAPLKQCHEAVTAFGKKFATAEIDSTLRNFTVNALGTVAYRLIQAARPPADLDHYQGSFLLNMQKEYVSLTPGPSPIGRGGIFAANDLMIICRNPWTDTDRGNRDRYSDP